MTRYRMSHDAAKANENQPVEKIPYVPAQRVTSSMSESQKEGVRIWNLMQKTLLTHGLMEERK